MQGDTCTAFQSTILRVAGWDRTKSLEKEKGYADVNLDRLTISNIYALHLTSNDKKNKKKKKKNKKNKKKKTKNKKKKKRKKKKKNKKNKKKKKK